MNWTSDKPTEPGRYWLREGGVETIIIVTAGNDRNLYAWFTGNEIDYLITDDFFAPGALWYGPLEPPEGDV